MKNCIGHTEQLKRVSKVMKYHIKIGLKSAMEPAVLVPVLVGYPVILKFGHHFVFN